MKQPIFPGLAVAGLGLVGLVLLLATDRPATPASRPLRLVQCIEEKPGNRTLPGTFCVVEIEGRGVCAILDTYPNRVMQCWR